MKKTKALIMRGATVSSLGVGDSIFYKRLIWVIHKIEKCFFSKKLRVILIRVDPQRFIDQEIIVLKETDRLIEIYKSEGVKDDN